MLRSLILMIALCFSGAALADTATLGPDACMGGLKQCYSIPNDAGLGVDFVATISSVGFNVYVDGVKYAAPAGNGLSIVSAPATAADGSTLLFSGEFSTYRTCTRSGRGQSCVTHWQFLGGSIVR